LEIVVNSLGQKQPAAQIHPPTLDAATRIDISNTTLITPVISDPPKAPVFRHF
jgi:hypothetical protein